MVTCQPWSRPPILALRVLVMRVVRQLEIYIYICYTLAPLKLSAPRYLFFEELLTFKWRRIIAYVNNSVDSRVDSKLKCNFYSMGLYSYAYIVLTHMHNKAYYIAKYMHTFWGSRRNEKKNINEIFHLSGIIRDKRIKNHAWGSVLARHFKIGCIHFLWRPN